MNSTYISAYTPSNTDVELLERIFVQRHPLLNSIVKKLEHSMVTGDKNHILLIGPRGAGKTHMLTLAHHRLQQNALKSEKLNQQMRVAWLGEDQTFTGLVNIAIAIAEALHKGYPTEFKANYKTYAKGMQGDKAAITILDHVITDLGDKSILLMMENLDRTFNNLGATGQQSWRAFLQETQKIATLASSQQLVESLNSRTEAFYGFFEIEHLTPLNIDQACELIAHIAQEQGKEQLLAYLKLPQARYRIRAIHYLAGGNHRMYVLLSELLTRESLDDLVSAFEKLADELTPYFQERIKSLPPQQGAIVEYLCTATGAISVKAIAEETFIEERTCSKQLSELKHKGYVKSTKNGKESYYEVNEPLMRLCIEIKNQRGKPLRLVAQFIRAWFSSDTLQKYQSQLTNNRTLQYCHEALTTEAIYDEPVKKLLQSSIKASIDKKQFEYAEQLIDELNCQDEDAAQFETFKLLFERSNTNFQKGAFELVIEDCSKLVNLSGGFVGLVTVALLMRGVTLEEQGKMGLAIEDYTTVINLPDAPVRYVAMALVNRGVTFKQQAKFELAIDDYTTLIKLPNAPVDLVAMALMNRGLTFGEQAKFELAIEDYTTLINLPNAPVDQVARALIHRGLTFWKQGKYELAIDDYTTLINLSNAPVDQVARALISRGLTFGQQGKFELEIEDYTTLNNLPNAPVDTVAKALVSRGAVWWKKAQYEEAKSDFNAVIQMDNIDAELKTQALFAIVETMVTTATLTTVCEAQLRAFKEGDNTCEVYGGAPDDLLAMVLKLGSSQWADYVLAFVPMFEDYKQTTKLGQGLVKSIEVLAKNDFSVTQLDTWNSIWQQAGATIEALELPLLALNAAVECIKTKNNRPLFALPVEIRGLVAPLLDSVLQNI